MTSGGPCVNCFGGAVFARIVPTPPFVFVFDFEFVFVLVMYLHSVHLVTIQVAPGSTTLERRFSPEWLFPRLQKLRHRALSERRGRSRSRIWRQSGRLGGKGRKGSLKQASRQLALNRQKNKATCKYHCPPPRATPPAPYPPSRV